MTDSPAAFATLVVWTLKAKKGKASFHSGEAPSCRLKQLHLLGFRHLIPCTPESQASLKIQVWDHKIPHWLPRVSSELITTTGRPKGERPVFP